DLVFIDAAAEINLKRTIKYYKSINARITLLVPQIDEEQILQLLKFDLDGYFCERMDVKEIAAAMKMVLKGHRYIHPYLASIMYKDYLRITNRKVVRPRGLLTKREWQILLEMAKGNTNDEIAQNLMISDKTVKNHVTAILRKLEVKDRTNAVLKAIKRGWVAFKAIKKNANRMKRFFGISQACSPSIRLKSRRNRSRHRLTSIS